MFLQNTLVIILFFKIIVFIFFNDNKFSIKFYNYFLYYFILDVFNNIFLFALNFFYDNNLFAKILLINLFYFFTFITIYLISSIIYFLINKNKITKTYYNHALKIFIFCFFMKMIYMINILKYQYTITYHSYNLLYSSLLFSSFFIFFYGLFFLFFLFPIAQNFFTYIKTYTVRDHFKKLYYWLAGYYIFFILCGYFILFNFELYLHTSSNYENIYFLLKNMNKILLFFYFLSFFIYIFFIFFLNYIRNITVISYNTAETQETSLHFLISDFLILLSYRYSFRDFLITILKKNIESELQLENNMFTVSFEKEIDFLLDEKNIIYNILKKTSSIVYDDYYKIFMHYHILHNQYKNDTFFHTLHSIINTFNTFNIRVIYKYNLNLVDNNFFYIIIYKNSFFKKKNINQNDISSLIKISDYIKYFYEQFNIHYLYSDLFYKKKVAELDSTENDYNFENNYSHLNDCLNNISQVLIYQSSKKNIKYLPTQYSNYNLLEEFKAETEKLYNQYHQDESKCVKNEIIFIEENRTKNELLLTQKFFLNKTLFSQNTLAPFLEYKNFPLDNFFLYKKIDSIFDFKDTFFYKEIDFFSELLSGFTIKIIVSQNIIYHSFFKMIDYFIILKNYQPIYISLADMNQTSFEKMFSYYVNILEKNKFYCILFKDIKKNNIPYQELFFKKYLEMFYHKNIFIKIFFLLENQNNIENLYNNIPIIGKSYFYDGFFSIIDKKYLIEILKKYQINLLQETYVESILLNFIKTYQTAPTKYFLQKRNNIYKILDDYLSFIKSHYYKKEPLYDEFYIKKGTEFKKKALKNRALMNELLRIYKNNYSQIASLLGVHKSTISRHFNKSRE